MRRCNPLDRGKFESVKKQLTSELGSGSTDRHLDVDDVVCNREATRWRDGDSEGWHGKNHLRGPTY